MMTIIKEKPDVCIHRNAYGFFVLIPWIEAIFDFFD